MPLERHEPAAAIVMWVLPGPALGSLARFDKRAVRVLAHVDQRHVTVVGLGLLVHERKDAPGARKRDDDRVELVGHLRHGVHKVARERQKRCDGAERERVETGKSQVGRSCDGHVATEHGHHHIDQVAKCVHHGHDRIAHALRVRRSLCPGTVELAHSGARGVLVTKDLDDLLPADHLLYVAVERAERILLLDRKRPDDPRDAAHEHEHRRHEHADHHGEPHARPKHAHKDRDQREYRAYELRERLRDHLAQGVGVVGVEAHDVAVRVCVEVTQGERLHVREHIVADAFERALRHGDHRAVVDERGRNAHHIDGADGDERVRKARPYGSVGRQKRDDVVVDECLQKHRRRGARDGREQNARDDEYKLSSVAGHIREQSLDGCHIELHRGHVGARRGSVCGAFLLLTHPLPFPSAATQRPRDRYRLCAKALHACPPRSRGRRPSRRSCQRA